MTDFQIGNVNAATLTKLHSIAATRVSTRKCPSLFATLFQGGTNLFQAGVGESSIGAGVPDSSTVYRIASMSKSFTVVMLLNLRDRGVLNLDAPITDFVPEFTQADVGRRYSPPTLRMLMSMSGGLPTDDPWADRQESISSAVFRDDVASGVLLTSAPGTLFQYSNLGYALLGQVVEVIAQHNFQELVKEEILLPLELHDTGYTEDVVSADRLAHGYRPRGAEWVELGFSRPGAFSSIGGLFSSGRDLTTWVRWLSSALSAAPDETGPLSVASRREMQQIVTSIPATATTATFSGKQERYSGYGFGLFSEYDQRFGQFVSHSGGYPGFSSHMRWHVPTGLAVVVLENATYSGAWDTAPELLERILEDADFHLPNVALWTRTINMAALADSLVRHWDDTVASQIFAVNVALDKPFDERRAQIEALVRELGGLTASPVLHFEEPKSDSPVHATWTIPAVHGGVRCEIRLSPTSPSLIQTLTVTKDSPQ